MKKMIALFLIMVMAWAFSPASSAQSENDFLILLYLCGTDLETRWGAASEDLQEIMMAGLTPDGPVTVLVHAGGTKRWQNNLLRSGESGRFLVSDDLYPVGPSLGQLDMGDPHTLRDFIRFGLETYPAKRVGLILWNHGAGSTGGICYDEITQNYLTNRDVRDALAQALVGGDQRLAFVGFDACLMSTFEMAVYLQPFADYMIASVELEPAIGWAYDRWLTSLVRNPAMDVEEIGRNIVNSFIESCLADDPNDYVTLSVTDLRELDSLIEAVDTFSQELNDELAKGSFATISRARAQMRAFGDFYDASSDMVDIAEAAWYLRDVAPEASRVLTRAAKNAVVYSRNSANIESVVGLSILLPDKTRSIANQYLPDYDPLSLIEGYSGFITDYLAHMTAGQHSFNAGSIEALELDPYDTASLGWLSSIASGGGQSAPVAGSWLEDSFDFGCQLSLTQEDLQEIAEEYGIAYMVQLSPKDLESLSYVEASLLQDAYGMVDEAYGDEVYFDYGLMQDVYVDWDDGLVYGLFDGTWPTLEGQMVPMYDQIVSEEYVRSLIPALVNDEEQYLLVVFNEANPYGSVVGYTESFDASGGASRGYQRLQPGDEIYPLYDLIFWDAQGEIQTDTFYGEEIIVGNRPLAFDYEPVEPGVYSYAFCLNDVYGGYEFTDFIELSF